MFTFPRALRNRPQDDDVMIGNLSKSESAFVPAMPLKTIEGLAAWRGVDFRNRDDFACQLSDADITEIETAVQAVIQGGGRTYCD
jgi:hypothetical protein